MNPLEATASIASILGTLLVIVAGLAKAWKSAKTRALRAEEELQSEIDRLRSAAGTIASRTDLGFWVVLNLGGLRDQVRVLQFYTVVYLLVAVLLSSSAFAVGASDSLVGLEVLQVPISRESYRLTKLAIAALFLLGAVGTTLLSHLTLRRVWRFEAQVKSIWGDRVALRDARNK